MLDEASRIFFGFFCHQDPSVLMTVGGQTVQLCPRCIGMHLGFALSFAASALLFRRGLVLSRTGPRVLLLLAVALLAFDWGVGGHLGLYEPTSRSRLLTGLACGSSLALLLTAYRTGLRSVSFEAPGSPGTLAIAGIIAVSVVAGVITASVSGWVLLTTLCAASVMANIALVLDTAVSMTRRRMRGARFVASSRPLSEGGAR